MANYPKGIDSWTNRVDEVDIVWAADPNSLAAEILAIENAVGMMPHVESKPPAGNPVQYSSLSARVTDTLLGNQLPYVDLSTSSFNVSFSSNYLPNYYGSYINYKVNYDPWGYFNGSDVTVKAPGLYLINSYTTWGYYNTGYLMTHLLVNGVESEDDRWDWDFPKSGPDDASYAGRWAVTKFTHMVPLQAGTRLRIIAENGTPKNPYPVINSYLRVFYLRSIPTTIATNR